MLIVPVYNQLVLPDANLFFPADSFQAAAGSHLSAGEKIIFVIARENIPRTQYTEDSFYPIGVTGYIQEENMSGFIVVHTDQRVNIENITVRADHTLMANISRRADIEDLDPQEEAEHLVNLKKLVKDYMSHFQWGKFVDGFVDQWTNEGEIIAALGMWLPLKPEEKYALLAEDSRKARNRRYEEILYSYLEVARVNADAQTATAQEYEQAYKEQAIKKQMEYLQNELDKMHPENVSDAARFQKKIEESGMNPTAREEADKMLNRLKQEGKNSPEYGNIYEYLDFVTSLNWKTPSAKKISLSEAQKVLDEDHFGLEKVKKRIIQQIAVMNLKHSQSGSILLFVGAPGTGKTSIAASIARALHRKYVRVSLGGVRDEADIRGHRRTYIGAMPGRIMDGIQKSGASNPVMVLDEVDKLGASYNGDPASALLEVLDPEQNATFTDHYMNVPYDLSHVFFICTANSIDNIPEPLLNRMEVIQFNGYTASDKFQIARKHLLPKAMSAMGIKDKDLEVTDDAIRTMIASYTMEGGVRGLKKVLDTLCRSCAVEIANGRKDTLVINQDNLKAYLDARPIHHDRVLKNDQPGIVTGLAWTAAGGEILFIESLMMKGTGKVTVTGQLGDVMKESVSIAMSLVRHRFPDKADVFANHDIHIHVPEGAVKKDGPSAGITLTTALASLVTGHPVDPSIGMTGEVSLRGKVMEIGGLPEKLMAAARAGVKTVLIPKDNVDDLKDVPQEARDALKIVPVDTVEDVLKYTGIIA